jgi:peroxiredoxin
MTTPALHPTAHIPETGDPAPNVTVQNLDGRDVSLADLWQGAARGLALVLLRHYRCPFCREHAREIEKHRDNFANAGIAVVLVGCGSLGEAIAFRDDLEISHPIYNDPDRIVYQAYGVGEATAGSQLTPALLIGGLRAAARGFLPRRSSGNPMQLQGQFLIDRGGIIRSVARPALMSDIPSAFALLADAANLP